MGKRALVSSGSYLEPVIGFSRAVRVGNHIVVGGTPPIAAGGGTTARGDAYGQAVRCLEIIAKAIADAGGRLEDVTRPASSSPISPIGKARRALMPSCSATSAR